MTSVGIIGFGRFGKVLANILQKGFAIKVYDENQNPSMHGIEKSSLDDVLNEKTVFIAVPIRNFESLIKNMFSGFKSK